MLWGPRRKAGVVLIALSSAGRLLQPGGEVCRFREGAGAQADAAGGISAGSHQSHDPPPRGLQRLHTGGEKRAAADGLFTKARWLWWDPERLVLLQEVHFLNIIIPGHLKFYEKMSINGHQPMFSRRGSLKEDFLTRCFNKDTKRRCPMKLQPSGSWSLSGKMYPPLTDENWTAAKTCLC